MGARCLHSGGVFAALSDKAPKLAEEAFAVARDTGTLVSYDLNHRESLWKAFGGDAKALEINRRLVSNADVLFAGRDDFSLRLGVDLSGLPASNKSHAQEEVLRRVAEAYPNLKAIAMTQRTAESSCKASLGSSGPGGRYVCRGGSASSGRA